MRIGRPRTLLGLILVALALVTLPLLIAIGNAALKLGQLAADSEAVASESAVTSLEMQKILSSLSDLERDARQFLVLREQELLDVYDSDRGTLRASVATLAALPQDLTVAAQLEYLAKSSEDIRALLHRNVPSEEALELVVNGFRGMNQTARDINQGMRVARNIQLNALQDRTRDTQQALLWQSAALVPGTIVLIFFFLVLVGRPLRQVDRAIRELGSGDFSHSIAVTGPRDIATLGRQLEWLRHRLKETTDEKNKFLRHMSHELKTPLANIREGTELLLDGSVGALDSQQLEVTTILRDNGVRLQKLIENLLNFSAWQTKTASLEISEFELKPLVFSVLSAHRLTISNQRIRLQLNISPIRISADAGKLRLVLENLVSNATKFLPNGGTLAIGAELRGRELVIDVADTGPGIAPDDRGRIFDAFYQGRRLQGGPVGGTGIGLSVVAECVQAHGGTVELVTGVWPGAHFQVKLPLRRASDRPALAVVNG